MKQILPLLALSLLYSGGVAFSQDDNEGTFQVKGAGDYVSEETAVPKSKKGVKLSEAFPEEINDKNFPDLIDTFDYPDIELKEMINIMGELTGKRFIYSDKEISGKISIISKQPISVAEAYKAFLSALQMNKLTILQSGKFLKIVKTRDAVKLNIETYSGTYFPNSDQMITKIIKLR
jgi:general secretion pathway protein D